VDGDFYIDTVAHMIYGPKASSAWPSGTSLVGPAGSISASTTTVTVDCTAVATTDSSHPVILSMGITEPDGTSVAIGHVTGTPSIPPIAPHSFARTTIADAPFGPYQIGLEAGTNGLGGNVSASATCNVASDVEDYFVPLTLPATLAGEVTDGFNVYHGTAAGSGALSPPST
jgi:hypothetical protein